MKKQWRMVLISGCVLVALLLTWLAASLLKPQETISTTTFATVAPLLKLAVADIQRAEFHSKNGDVAVYPKEITDSDGKTSIIWVLDTVKDYPFDQDTIDEMGSLATQLSVTDDIATGVTDLATYGLDDPIATMTVILKSGQKHVVKIGDELVTGYYDYAMLDDNGRLCKMPTSTGDKIQRTLLDFLGNSKVVDITTKELTHLEFSRARDKINIVMDCELIGEASADTSYLKFTVTSPIKRSGSIDPLNTLAVQATTVTAQTFVEYDPADLSVYGLDQPAYTFVMRTKEKSVVLKIGGKMPDSQTYFAISDAMPVVFTCSVSDLAAIDLPLMDMLDRMFNLQNIWGVSKIECNILGTLFDVEINIENAQRADDEGVVFKIDGQNARIFSEDDDNLFGKVFYERLISPMIAGLDPEAQPINTHDASIIYHIKEDTENSVPAYIKTVEFSRRDDYTYYVFIDNVYTGFFVNGQDTFTSKEEDDEGILVAYKKMKYAMAHAVDGVFDTTKGYLID
jgi:hypothetical protein